MSRIIGWYNNTAKTAITNSSQTADIDWMNKNRVKFDGFDYNTFYDNGSLLNNTKFPAYVLSAYLKKIKCGIPFSADSEVNQAITYNKNQTDSRCKISHLVSEAEDYGNGNVTPAQFKALLENNYIKAKGASIPFGVYNGWTKQWNVVVKNSDFLLLHSYRSSTQMATKDDLYNYTKSRLILIAAEAKALKKIYPVSIIYSCEPSFGMDYFKTHAWADAQTSFMDSWNRLATADMKNCLSISGAYYFVTKYGKQAKP